MSIFFGPSKWGSFFEPFFVSLWYRLHFGRTFCQVFFAVILHKSGHEAFSNLHCRSSVNTSYITGLDMCKECPEAVHSVAV